MFEKLFGTKKPKDPPKPPRDVEALTARFGTPALQLMKTQAGVRSHLLGKPEMASSFRWPMRSGNALTLLAALDLAEIQSALAVEWLPRSGTLLFFYDTEKQPWGFDPKDRDGWAVVHMPEQCPVRTTAAFPSSSGPVGISFSRLNSLPSWERAEIEALQLNDEESDAYCDLCDRMFGGKPKHQLFGYPSPVQGDHMELESQLVSNGIYCGNEKGYKSAEAKALESGASEWRLLFQMDSDEDLDLMWGDAGLLYFWIRESDARANDFSKVWLISQCH